ncbi:MAG: cation diffusion facilitator family transporter [Coprobacillus sp.]
MDASQENSKIAIQVSILTIVVNTILSIFKLIAGLLGNSTAMVSDAIHSASDVFSTFIVIIGIKISSKEKDTLHPYGHERLECIAAIVLALVLAITGIGIGISAIKNIQLSLNSKLTITGMLPLMAAFISIAVKEWMYWYTRAAAKKINSSSMMADAWHHRSDSLSSIGSLIGVGGAMLGFTILDPIASIVICFMILKVAYDIINETINKLIDTSCSDEICNAITEIVLSQSGVIAIDELKTRMFASKFYVDIEICADGNLTLFQAHDIAEKVHDAIEQHFPDAKHCMVHVNPQAKYCVVGKYIT